MKKTLATLLACILAFSLFTGCGEQTPEKEKSPTELSGERQQKPSESAGGEETLRNSEEKPKAPAKDGEKRPERPNKKDGKQPPEGGCFLFGMQKAVAEATAFLDHYLIWTLTGM